MKFSSCSRKFTTTEAGMFPVTIIAFGLDVFWLDAFNRVMVVCTFDAGYFQMAVHFGMPKALKSSDSIFDLIVPWKIYQDQVHGNIFDSLGR